MKYIFVGLLLVAGGLFLSTLSGLLELKLLEEEDNDDEQS